MRGLSPDPKKRRERLARALADAREMYTYHLARWPRDPWTAELKFHVDNLQAELTELKESPQ